MACSYGLSFFAIASWQDRTLHSTDGEPVQVAQVGKRRWLRPRRDIIFVRACYLRTHIAHNSE